MKKGAQKKAIESYLQENIGNNPVILAAWLKYLIPLKTLLKHKAYFILMPLFTALKYISYQYNASSDNHFSPGNAGNEAQRFDWLHVGCEIVKFFLASVQSYRSVDKGDSCDATVAQSRG